MLQNRFRAIAAAIVVMLIGGFAIAALPTGEAESGRVIVAADPSADPRTRLFPATSPSTQSANCVLVSTYAAPGSGDATAGLQNAFAAVADNGCITFDVAGTYRLDMGESLDLDGHSGVQVYGNGARIQVHGYDASQDLSLDPVISMMSTTRVTVADLVLALEDPNHIFGTVLSRGASATDGDFTVTVDSGYSARPSLADSTKLYVEHVMHWTNATTPGDWEVFAATVGCGGTCSGSTTTLTVETTAGSEPPVGQKVLIMHDKRQHRGIDVSDSTGAQLNGITVENIAGSALYGNRVTDLTVDGLTSRPTTVGTGHVSANDLTFIRGAAGDFNFSNINASFQTDDVFNVHAPQMRVTGSGTSYAYAQGARLNAFAVTGDTVLLYDTNFQYLGEETVTVVNPSSYTIANAVGDVEYMVAKKWVPATTTLTSYDVSSTRSRILVKVPNVTITDCDISKNMMSGIEVRYRSEAVAEAGMTDNVVIEDCIFTDVARFARQHVAAIVISADIAGGLATVPVHGTVTIRDSSFNTLKQAAIVSHAVNTVVIQNNSFSGIGKTANNFNQFNTAWPPFKAGQYTIAFAATTTATLSGNSETGGTLTLGCATGTIVC